MSDVPAEPRKLRIPRPVRVVFALMMREMSTTYGRSSIGYLWAILEPVGGIVILSLAFSLFLRSPPVGDNFPLFYATGFLPFNVFTRLQASGMQAIRSNKMLLFYPEVSYIDAILARFFLAMITQALVTIIVIWGIVAIFGLRVQVDLGIACLSILLSGFLGIGIGTVNSVLIHLLPSWEQVWSVLTRPLFIMSCVFFTFDTLPLWAQNILWFNPLVHVVGLMRIGVYSTYSGSYVSPMYVAVVAGVSLLVGLLMLRRFAKDMINF